MGQDFLDIQYRMFPCVILKIRFCHVKVGNPAFLPRVHLVCAGLELDGSAFTAPGDLAFVLRHL